MFLRPALGINLNGCGGWASRDPASRTIRLASDSKASLADVLEPLLVVRNSRDFTRASNYRPRNQYRDRFFNENGTHTTVPGAIPKALRAYTTAPLLSTNQRDPYTYSSQDDGGNIQKDTQQEEEEGDEDHVVGDGEDSMNFYERPAWEQEDWALRVREPDQAKKSTSRRDRTRRSLLDTDSDEEPAIESPLSCVSKGDSVIFDISSGCYPVYEKDSLLNSNPE